MKGVVNSQDDIIVYAKSKKEHDDLLLELFKRIRDSGLKLNRQKCSFGVTQLIFLGHIVSSDGIKPDPKKVDAITEMSMPTTKQELQRFMGMVNYLGKFIPNLSDVTAPLRLLLQKDYEFLMQEPQVEAIDKIKNLLSSAPVLAFFDPNLPTRLRTDSSVEGLGAMIISLIEQLHSDGWRPIGYKSKATTNAQKLTLEWTPIERETLSVLFGCEIFHEYLYGRHFTAQNDHQPLKTIFNKSISQCPPRIQSLFLELQKYDFDLEYVPGSKMVVSDTFSSASLTGKVFNSIEKVVVHLL